MEQPILSVRHLTTQIFVDGAYRNVVDKLSFDLEAGKTLAIVGESGSGKTMVAQSILQLIAQELRPKIEGEIFYGGQDILKMSAKSVRKLRGKKLGFIMQNAQSSLNPVYTIYDQLKEALYLTKPKLSDLEAKELIIDTLYFVGLDNVQERMHDYPHQFSGGMKQRAIIAMALLQEPEVLIADEPTTALDVTVQKQILQLLKKIQKEKGLAIVLISHDMGIVKYIADDILVMYASQLMEVASTESILKQAMHPYSQALFSARPSLSRKAQRLDTIPGALPSLKARPKGCLFHPRCSKVLSECMTDETITVHQKDNHQVRCRLYD